MGMFHILEHTADKGLEVEAGNLPELFETAARGLFHLMIDPDAYPPTETIAIAVNAPDLGMLMVKWLNELVYQFEVHHRLFSGYSDVAVEQLADGRWQARAQAHYRPIAPQELEWDGAPVKSVTYHGLRLERESELWRLRFYVDV
ncbi:MAG: archease [Fimbriimonadales bacterium]|nr:archease [Fimbriimonadales bacterium]